MGLYMEYWEVEGSERCCLRMDFSSSYWLRNILFFLWKTFNWREKKKRWTIKRLTSSWDACDCETVWESRDEFKTRSHRIKSQNFIQSHKKITIKSEQLKSSSSRRHSIAWLIQPLQSRSCTLEKKWTWKLQAKVQKYILVIQWRKFLHENSQFKQSLEVCFS